MYHSNTAKAPKIQDEDLKTWFNCLESHITDANFALEESMNYGAAQHMKYALDDVDHLRSLLGLSNVS